MLHNSKTQTSKRFLMGFLLLLALGTASAPQSAALEAPYRCQPTEADEMGPFYFPDAPKRNSVGTGYLLFGTVRSAADCAPIPEAMLELWMNGPEGHYGDDWRATLFSSDSGTYYFTSHTPTDFGRRRPHIHMRVTAEGFAALVTQHYPLEGAGEGLFDLVLIPLAEQ